MSSMPEPTPFDTGTTDKAKRELERRLDYIKDYTEEQLLARIWGLSTDVALAWEEGRIDDAEFLQVTLDACHKIKDLRDRWAATPMFTKLRITQNAAELKRRADIVRVIESLTTTKLRPAGKQLKGLCPFHEERTPSFNVAPDKGLWHCFGCGQGGDVFDFVRHLFPVMSFQETVEMVAAGAGIDPKPYLGGSTQPNSRPTPIRDSRAQSPHFEFTGGRVVSR